MQYFLALFCIFLFSAEAFAQSTGQVRRSGNDLQVYDGSTWDTVNHGGGSSGSCTTGQMRYTTAGTNRVEYCRGGTWVTAHSGQTTGSCSSGGQIRRSGGELQFCNGSAWVRMNPAGPSPINGVCGSAASGAAVTAQPTTNLCSAGTFVELSDTASWWQWRCNGQHGGSNSGTCQRARTSGGGGSCGTWTNTRRCTGTQVGTQMSLTGATNIQRAICEGTCNPQPTATCAQIGVARGVPVCRCYNGTPTSVSSGFQAASCPSGGDGTISNCSSGSIFGGIHECNLGGGTHGQIVGGSCLSTSGSCAAACVDGSWVQVAFTCSGVPF